MKFSTELHWAQYLHQTIVGLSRLNRIPIGRSRFTPKRVTYATVYEVAVLADAIKCDMGAELPDHGEKGQWCTDQRQIMYYALQEDNIQQVSPLTGKWSKI